MRRLYYGAVAIQFFRFPDLSTGSSIMPQNPDSAELIRAKLEEFIITNEHSNCFKGFTYGYSKDLQEDKEAVFDSYSSIEIILDVTDEMIRSVKINKAQMLSASFQGYSTATDLADWIVKKLDRTFREAHHITGKIVLIAEENKKSLDKLDLTLMQSVEPKITKDV